MPCTECGPPQRCIDQAALAIGEAERIDTLAVVVGVNNIRQRAFRATIRRAPPRRARRRIRAPATNARCRMRGSRVSARTRISVSRGYARAANGSSSSGSSLAGASICSAQEWRDASGRSSRTGFRYRRAPARMSRLAEHANAEGLIAGVAHGCGPSAADPRPARRAAAANGHSSAVVGDHENAGNGAHGDSGGSEAAIIADPLQSVPPSHAVTARGRAMVRLATRDAARVDSFKPFPGIRACPFPPAFSRFSH